MYFDPLLIRRRFGRQISLLYIFNLNFSSKFKLKNQQRLFTKVAVGFFPVDPSFGGLLFGRKDGNRLKSSKFIESK